MNSPGQYKAGASATASLRLRNISKLYPGAVVLNNVSIDIESGECHGIIGKNGAGKTTLVKIISGVIAPDQGHIFINGKPCNHLSRRQAKKLGISIVTQEPQVIAEFTVAENLLFPDYPCMAGQKINWSRIYQKSEAVLKQARLPLALKTTSGDLSISEQQLLLVIKAFFVDQNDIVILDEVTAALSRGEQEYLFELIDEQKNKGKAIVFISHRMAEIIRICDRITVLRDAKKIVSQEKKALRKTNLARLIVGDAFVDKKIRFAGPETASSPKRLLAVENLTIAGKFQDVSLSVNQGEVIGLAGLRGSGRTDLLKTIAGAYQKDWGNILLKGKSVQFKRPEEALRAGIAYLPEDRDQEGLVEILSVKANITLSSLFKFTKNLIINTKKENQAAQKRIDDFDIKIATREQEVKTLSGGNRQKVVIGKMMAVAPIVFLLDEPTKGIDIGAKNVVLNTVRTEMTKSGGVLMTSPSVEDLVMVCDRIAVIFEGKIIREFKREEFDVNRIYLSIHGVDPTSGKEDSRFDSSGTNKEI